MVAGKPTYEELVQKIGTLEEQLRATQASYRDVSERFSKLLSTIPDPVTIIKLDSGICVDVNEQFCRYSGWTRDEIVGQTYKTAEIWVNEEDRARFIEAIHRDGVVQNLEAQFRRRDRSVFTGLFSAAYFTVEGEPHILSITRDITGLKMAEEEHLNLVKKLEHARKMEALGVMAGGVAHDLNNILTSLVGYPDILLHSRDMSPDIRRGLEIMRDAGYRASAVVQDLLTIARGAMHEFRVLDPAALVAETLHSPEGLHIRENNPLITIEQRCDAKVWPIEGAAVHIRKSLVNLLMNAAESIDNRGGITITLHNLHLEEPREAFDSIPPGDYVVVSVADTGKGISEADRNRIFEPFYSRKVMGRSGTGLGLTMVWNAMRDHHGFIDVISSAEGTTFELYFPASPHLAAGTAVTVPMAAFKGAGQRVLVVDDEEAQRSVASQVLSLLGYRVSTAPNGHEAVEMGRAQTFDLLVLDMIMDPGIDGLATFEKLKAIQPEVKAIIVSGFADTDKVKKAQALGAGAFLPKPYTIEQFGIAVRDELAR